MTAQLEVLHVNRQRGLKDALGADTDHLRDFTDVVPAAIAFANGDIRPNWMTRAWPNERADSTPETRWTKPIPKSPWFVSVDENTARKEAELLIEDERREAIEVLDAIVTGDPSLAPFLAASTRPDSSRSTHWMSIVITPKLRAEGANLAIDWQITSESNHSSSWIFFAAALIARELREGRTPLGRCQLESCRRFFLIERGALGKPRTQYCQPEHRLAHHAQRATERQRKARAKKRGSRRPK